MKILVFSDSHGRISPMLDLIRLHRPDTIFHLGDVSRDLEPLCLEWPDLKAVSVPGNCDGWTGRPAERVVELEGARLLLTHGHAYHVKAGLGGLIAAAKAQGVDAALFGHTHTPFCERIDGIWFFNPGSVGSDCRADYGIITVEKGGLTCRLEQKRWGGEEMLIAVDVGNTNMEFGIFRGKELVGSFRLTTNSSCTSDEIGLAACQYFERFGLEPGEVKGVILSSVVPSVMYSLTSAMKKYFGREPDVVDGNVDPGLPYGVPGDERLGPDRSVACVAAVEKYGKPVIVLDFGTATTVDAVDGEGRYMGGCIAAGLRLTMDALTGGAAMLPNVDLAAPERILNCTAVGHIRAGVVGGYIGAVEYLVRRAKEELGCGDVKVVATGGLSRFIADGTDCIDVVDQQLVLDGLRILYERERGGAGTAES